MDLVGVGLADLVRLYLTRLDSTRSYVACASLVADQRLVSVRAPRSLTATAVVGVLRRHGYGLVDQDGVTYVCPIGGERQSGSGGLSGDATSAPASSPFAIDQGGADGQAAMRPAVVTSAFQDVAQDKRTPFDRLVSAGWSFAGCVDTDDGVKVALKGPQGTVMFTKRDMAKSDASAFMRCRL